MTMKKNEGISAMAGASVAILTMPYIGVFGLILGVVVACTACLIITQENANK